MYNIFRVSGEKVSSGLAKRLDGRLLFDEEHIEGRIVCLEDDTTQFVLGRIYFLTEHQGTIIELAEENVDETSTDQPNRYYVAVKNGDPKEIFGKYEGRMRNDWHIKINEKDTVRDIETRMMQSVGISAQNPIGSIERITLELFYEGQGLFGTEYQNKDSEYQE